MATERTRDYNAEPRPEPGKLRGGTQGSDEPSRDVDPTHKEGAGGTPGSAGGSGDVHPERPSRAHPNTDIGRTP